MSADSKISDFFVAGGTLRPDAPSYIKRPADDELFNQALAGAFCYVLTARQMGKSSLMTRTERRLQEVGVSTATIDLTGIGTVNIDAWYLGLLTELTRQLHLATDPEAWWQERASLGQPQRFTNFLRDVVLTEIKGQVVIFIDEIDSTLNLDFADDFFAAIRFTYNARATDAAYARLTFVLLGVATPSDLIKDASRTPFNIGRGIDLREFSWTDVQPLQQGLTHDDPEQGEALLHRIFYWTNGHPYLTQKLCTVIAKSEDGPGSETQVDELVERLFLSEEARHEDNLKFVQRNVEGMKGGQRRRLLSLYRRVYEEKKVKEDERSLDQNRLKLFALVGAKNGVLQMRNEIYRRAFNLDWIKANTPVDWNRWIAVAAVLVALVLGFYIWQQGQQTNETLAQTYTENFNNTTNPVLRLGALADLFGLEGYDDEARTRFDLLSPDEKIALFSGDMTGLQPQVRTMVRGIYTYLDDTEDNNRLLQAMQTALEQSDEADSKILAIEISHWLEGRAALAAGNYEEARQGYDNAIDTNDANPATHFERAVVLTNLADYQGALADFETTLTLDESRREQVQREVMSNRQLYDAWWDNRDKYPSLTALVPTPTRTHTPTETLTPIPRTSTPTPLPITSTSTWTPTPTNTPPPPTLTVTSSPSIPTNTPPLPTPTPTPVAIGRIAFTSDRDGNYEIYVVNTDGSEQIRLTNNSFYDQEPSWAPDGVRIAFAYSEAPPPPSQYSWVIAWWSSINVINLDSREVIKLTSGGLVEDTSGGFAPSWSPNGIYIALESYQEAQGEIDVMNADGSGYTHISQNPAGDGFPAWSPDSRRIVFVSERDGNPEIYVMSSNGNNQTRLTNHAARDWTPAWSPDGSRIVFMSNRDGNDEIYMMNADGSIQTRLTDNPAYDGEPSWSPDGGRIAFVSNRDGNKEIYVMNADGSEQMNLTNNPAQDWSPAWSPK